MWPIPRRDTSSGEDYSRVITPEAAITDEVEDVCAMLAECLEMRKKWLFKPAGAWVGACVCMHACVRVRACMASVA